MTPETSSEMQAAADAMFGGLIEYQKTTKLLADVLAHPAHFPEPVRRLASLAQERGETITKLAAQRDAFQEFAEEPHQKMRVILDKHLSLLNIQVSQAISQAISQAAQGIREDYLALLPGTPSSTHQNPNNQPANQ